MPPAASTSPSASSRKPNPAYSPETNPCSPASLAGIPRIAFEEFAATLPFPPFDAPLQKPELGPETPLQILFTSGTTSEPKGIVHTHGNVLASLEPIESEMQKYLRYERIFHPLRFLHTLPLSHVFGQFMGLWIPPLLAAEVHFENRLQAPRLLDLIHRQRISVLAAVPRVLDLLKSHLEERFSALPARLESSHGQRIWHRWWKFRDVHREFGFKFWAFVCGGASLPPPLERFWNDLGFALIQGYGMTETAALVTLNHPFHIAQGTIGKPLPGREIRIGDDGEILVRGAMVASARWQNGRMQTLPDPWLATGDLVEQDGDGQLRFLGRKSETIVTSAGLNIHPEDVEAALNRQPGVEASAVVPLDTACRHGCRRRSDLSRQSGAGPVRNRCGKRRPRRNINAFAVGGCGRNWIFRAPPSEKSSAGQLPSGSPPSVPAHNGSIHSRSIQRASTHLWSTQRVPCFPSPLQRRTHCPRSSRPSPAPRLQSSTTRRALTATCNLDSLARVQLQTELEQRLGVSIGDEEFERIATLGQLRARLGFGHPERASPGGSNFRAIQALQPAIDPPPAPDRRQLTLAIAAPPPPALANRTALRFIYPQWTWWPAVQAMRVLFQEAVMRPLVWLLAAPAVSCEASLAFRDAPPLC